MHTIKGSFYQFTSDNRSHEGAAGQNIERNQVEPQRDNRSRVNDETQRLGASTHSAASHFLDSPVFTGFSAADLINRAADTWQ